MVSGARTPSARPAFVESGPFRAAGDASSTFHREPATPIGVVRGTVRGVGAVEGLLAADAVAADQKPVRAPIRKIACIESAAGRPHIASGLGHVEAARLAVIL
jgi:hypothetical protein